MRFHSLGVWCLALAAVACETASDPSVVIREAMVSSVSVSLLESFPVRAQAAVRGGLSDGCTALGDVTTTRDGNEFRIVLTTTRPADAICTQAIVPFEHTVELDVAGLPAGEYRVVANDVAASFRLDVDNGS